MSNKVRVGICGLGTVGGGVFNVLTRNAQLIEARLGVSLDVVHIGARRDNPLINTRDITVSRDIFAVAKDPNVDIVVELIGGCDVAKQLILDAIKNGKHIVTANKALIAEHGNEIFAAAAKNNVSVLFEAAVAGGIPIIKALREGLSANKVNWLAGIINGTGNFILTEMREKSRDFADVLAEAQALGYAEADPSFDIEGTDAAHKLMILASLAFGMPLDFERVFTEGISHVDPLDIAYADELGYRIKHLGIARRSQKGDRIEVRVHPTLLPADSMLANVNGVMNAVMVNGDAVGSTLYYGAGAGAEPTASAVVADLVDVARSILQAQSSPVPEMSFTKLQDLELVPIEEIESAYYIRLTADDKPGVLSDIAQRLSQQGVSIEAMIQKQPRAGATQVPIILLSNVTQEKNINQALKHIEGLEAVQSPIVRIRVDSLST